MKPRKAKIVVIALEVLALLFMVVGLLLGGWNEMVLAVLAIIGFLLFVTGAVLALLFWRCPWCHRIMPLQRMISIEFCPYCGTDIDDKN